jgi:tetratricopeptide (TPR) repeat protein
VQPPADDTDQVLLDFADGTVYIGTLRYAVRDEKIPQLEALAEAGKRLGRKDAQGMALGNLGLAYSSLGEYQRAIEYHEQYLAIAREIGDRRGEGTALGNLGLAYNDLGEYQRAIDYHEQALVISREIGDRRGEGSDLGNLGIAYKNLGEYQRAIEYYEQGLVVDREIGDIQGEAIDSWNLGLLYEQQGELARAEPLIAHAAAFMAQIGHATRAKKYADGLARVRAKLREGGG